MNERLPKLGPVPPSWNYLEIKWRCNVLSIKFYDVVRTSRKGDDNELESLKITQCAVERYLKEKNYSLVFAHSREFFNSNSRCALVQFWNYAYDFKPNCTPLSLITIINWQKFERFFFSLVSLVLVPIEMATSWTLSYSQLCSQCLEM